MVLKQQMRCHKVSSTLISRKKIVKFVFLYGLLNKLQFLTSSQPILLKKNLFSKGFTWPELFQPLWNLKN